MVDGFWYGIIGGIFGPPIANWMARFKYWIIFLVAMIGTHIGMFVAVAYAKGLQFSIEVTLRNTFTPVGILVPIGISLLAIFIVFIGSLGGPEKNK